MGKAHSPDLPEDEVCFAGSTVIFRLDSITEAFAGATETIGKISGAVDDITDPLCHLNFLRLLQIRISLIFRAFLCSG